MFIYVGIKHQGAGSYVKGVLFPPGVPLPPLCDPHPAGFISTFVVRPFSLAVRLMANMVAGQICFSPSSLSTAYLLDRPLTIGFGVLSAAISVVMVGFEIFVAALQAFIFVMLTVVYISGSS